MVLPGSRVGKLTGWNRLVCPCTKTVQDTNKVCARRSSWGSIYGQEFDSPHLHQRQAAAPKTRTSLLWGALFLHPRLRQMFFVNASQAVPGRTLRSRSVFFCLSAHTQRQGFFCQCVPIESLGTQFAFGAFFIWLDDRAYSGYLFCQRLLKRLNIRCSGAFLR